MSDPKSRDEIQRLLREAEIAVGTPIKSELEAQKDGPPTTGGRGAYKELNSLIGSLDLDIHTPAHSRGNVTGGRLAETVNAANPVTDSEDFSVLHFGA